MTAEPLRRWYSTAPAAAAHVVLWLYAYCAFEWLFFVTKDSVVSSATWGVRLLMLLLPPLAAAAVLVPVQLFLAGVETAFPARWPRWLTAILPAALATAFVFIAIENFSRTTFHAGVADVTGPGRWVVLAACLVVWSVAIARIARRPVIRRPVVLATSVVLLVALIAGGILTVRHSSAPVRARRTAGNLPRWNVLLVGIDGLTANRMSVYGAARPTTPRIAAFARAATLFENAFPNAGVTCGSLISVLTGRRPTETHVFGCPVYLEGELATQHLPSVLNDLGYASAQIGVREVADARDWNMQGAFQQVNGRIVEGEMLRPSRSTAYFRVRRFAEEVADRIESRALHLVGIRPMVDTYRLLTGTSTNASFSDRMRMRLAKDFIAARREPWFLHMHMIDTHCCDWGFAPARFTRDTALRDARWRADRSDDALLQIDGYFGELLDLLRDTRQLDRTIVVLFSDHSMGWTTIERIPLLIAIPGQPGGKRVSRNVELIDIAPTIVEALAVERPAWMDGRSLLDPSPAETVRPIFALWESQSGTMTATPLFGGARSATAVVCDTWVELDLSTLSVMRTGKVSGHTAPCRGDRLEDAAAASLRKHLELAGADREDHEPQRRTGAAGPHRAGLSHAAPSVRH